MLKIFDKRRSVTQQLVALFMKMAGQRRPSAPIELTEAERLLRVRLSFEEVLEKANAHGVAIKFVVVEGANPGYAFQINAGHVDEKNPSQPHGFEISGPFDMKEALDSCGDLNVVNQGDLVAMGVCDVGLFEEIDNNNLLKFTRPGGYKDAGGKWKKPDDHPKPDTQGVLDRQGYLPPDKRPMEYGQACFHLDDMNTPDQPEGDGQ